MLKALLVTGVALAGGAAALVEWPQADVYKVTFADAEARLHRLELDRGILKGASATLEEADGADGERVYTWRFGRPLSTPGPARCMVALAAVRPERTRATLACRVDRQDGDRLLGDRAAELIRIHVAEHVGSALEGRPYDYGNVGLGTMQFAAKHNRELFEHMETRRRTAR
jgi:hypothetical protein